MERLRMKLEQQLRSVQEAIARIEEGGQEIDLEVNDHRRRVVRARLNDLYDRETKLKLAISRKRNGGMIDAIPC
jgi:hypothetical protein